jgi:hypothetical protein
MGMLIEGQPDKHKLEHTLNQLVQRHESLRTKFHLQDGKIIQKIEENPVCQLKFYEDGAWDEDDIDKIINGDIEIDKKTPESDDNLSEPEDNLLSGVTLTKVRRKPKELK